MQKKIITISRECGSGGHTIGQELAKAWLQRKKGIQKKLLKIKGSI